jgi:predicted metal-dependent hydrolase
VSKLKLLKDISNVLFGKETAAKAATPVPDVETLRVGKFNVEVSRKNKKRRMSLTLQPSGRVLVSTAVKTPNEDIKKFLLGNMNWIEKQTAKFEKLREKFPKKEFKDGEKFLFLGKPHILRYKKGEASRLHFKQTDKEFVCEIPPDLWTKFEPQAPHPEMATLFQRFYEKVGREVLEQRVKEISEKMKLQPSSVIYRSQKTRWGSCNSKGQISLNWRLAFASLEVIDYVVTHELAHLKHYDHSPKFWALVEKHISNYKKPQRWLKSHQYEADFLGGTSELHDGELDL